MLEPITNIKNLIPQKDPFIMVDALQSHTKDKATSSFKIQKDNILFYEDNFIEAGLIENMAQTVALHTGYDYFVRGEKSPTGYIGAIKNVEIGMLPKHNDIIKTEVEIVQEFNGITMVNVVVFNDKNEKIASCQMKTAIISS